MKPSRLGLSLCLAGLVLCSSSLQAVIVAGANGGGNTTNNTTAASLDTWAFNSGLPAFSYYENVINYSDATGIYLGFNSATLDVWVLTAKHVANSNADITIQGDSYVFQQRIELGNADIELVRYRSTTLEVPSLSQIKFATALPTTSQDVVMVGIGKDRVQDATVSREVTDAVTLAPSNFEGYQWDTDRVKRWGTNRVEANFPDALESNVVKEAGILGTYLGTRGYSLDFDEPLNFPGPNNGPWLSTNEAMGSLGDSGGGLFIVENGEWVLSGIFSSVTSFNGQPANTSAFNNSSLTTDIFTFSNDINQQIGVVLVPEPAFLGAGLAAFAVVGFLRRYPRNRS